MTLRSLERGGTGVTIGAYLAVMQVLGIERDLDLLAQADPTGHALQDARVSTRRKTTARPRPSTVPNPPQRTHVSVGPATTQLHQLIENAPQAQLPKLFDSLPTEQMRTALDALPETQIQQALSVLSSEQLREFADASADAAEKLLKPADYARNWIDKSTSLLETARHEQLRSVFESLPTEQMRKVLEALSETQIQKALANLPSEQMRKTLEASASAIENLVKPVKDAQDWIEKNGFASSHALADLIDSVAPPSKAKGR